VRREKWEREESKKPSFRQCHYHCPETGQGRKDYCVSSVEGNTRVNPLEKDSHD